jgi:hypothetical protein
MTLGLVPWARALVAGVIGYVASGYMINRVQRGNRKIEWEVNEQSDELSQSQKDWQIVHIRDDVGSIAGLLAITNALLAAILACLI